MLSELGTTASLGVEEMHAFPWDKKKGQTQQGRVSWSPPDSPHHLWKRESRGEQSQAAEESLSWDQCLQETPGEQGHRSFLTTAAQFYALKEV